MSTDDPGLPLPSSYFGTNLLSDIPFSTGLSRVRLLSILLETFAVTSVLSATSVSEIVTTPSGDTDTLSGDLPFTVHLLPDFVTVTVSGLVLPVGV
ncbi:hypothetical protein D8842_09425 [Streptococcus mitis]|nr:hypothetical protein D8842_09425 [Streptococcus mitis]